MNPTINHFLLQAATNLLLTANPDIDMHMKFQFNSVNVTSII